MKKFVAVLSAAAMLCSLAACGSTASSAASSEAVIGGADSPTTVYVTG